LEITSWEEEAELKYVCYLKAAVAHGRIWETALNHGLLTLERRIYNLVAFWLCQRFKDDGVDWDIRETGQWHICWAYWCLLAKWEGWSLGCRIRLWKLKGNLSLAIVNWTLVLGPVISV
jgi:hypothetical protein